MQDDNAGDNAHIGRCGRCHMTSRRRLLRIGDDRCLCCIVCADPLTREFVPAFQLTTSFAVVSRAGAGCMATTFDLSSLWHWPVDDDGFITSLPTCLVVLVDDTTRLCLDGSLDDVADRLKPSVLPAASDHHFFQVTPGMARDELRSRIRLALVRDYGAHCDQARDDLLIWKVPVWSRPGHPLGTVNYNPLMTDVEREEAELPGIIVSACGLLAPLAALVCEYRRPTIHVAKLREAIAEADRAWSAAHALLDDEYRRAQHAAHAEHIRVTAAALVATAALADELDTRAGKRQRVA